MDSFKRFNAEKLSGKEFFYSSTKNEATGDDSKKIDDYINDEDYLTCKNNWYEINMKNIGDYHNHYLKKDVLLLVGVFGKFIDTCLKF